MGLSHRLFAIKAVLIVCIILVLSQHLPTQGQGKPTAPPTNTPRITVTKGPSPIPSRTSTLTRTPTNTRTPSATLTLKPTITPRISKTPTLKPSNTLKPTITPTPSTTLTPSITLTPTITLTPSITLTPTIAPTMVIMGTYITPAALPITQIPPAIATPQAPTDDVVTVLLLGSDTTTKGAAARTDTIILLAINRTRNTVTMLHIPRDLLVYVPNYTMTKIDSIFNYGNVRYGLGGGAKLLEDTIQYNLGLKVNFYARLNFVEFEQVITKLGGLDVSVDCALQDYRLKDPTLDVTKPENYELYTLPIGYQHLSPYMALWYVRSEVSTSDFDRGLREMQELRAMWQQISKANLVDQLTNLWPDVQKTIETDMTINDVINLVPVSLNIDPSRIQRLELTVGKQVKEWTMPDTGDYTVLPNQDALAQTIQNFLLPVATNRLGGESPTVQIAAAAPLKGLDQVAADMLSWDGFNASVTSNEGVISRNETVVYDYTGNAKPNSLNDLLKTLRMQPTDVIEKPDPARTVDFRVEMGKDFTNCVDSLPASQVTPQVSLTPVKPSPN